MQNNISAERNGLSTASLVFGILALIFSVFIVFTPFNAALAITFSWLSRGDKKMNGQAIAGNILGLISIVISIAVVVALFITFMHYALEFLQNNIEPMMREIEPYINQYLNMYR